jgi:iron complex outermembrane receptor protein
MLGNDVKKLLLLATMLSTPVFAQATAHSKAPAAGAHAEAEEGVTDIGDIVVTAQRRSQRVQDVPATLVVKTGEDLTRAGVINTQDLQRVVPGLVFTFTGSWAQPNMRGVSTTVTGPGSDNPVAIYLDGVYQGNQVGSAFDLPDVERVEVLKGPQGTLFGRNATGGAIQIFTKQPSFTTTGMISTSVGFHDGAGASRSAMTGTVKGYISGPLTSTLAASITGLYGYEQGYLNDIVDNSRFGEWKNRMVRGKLLFEPSADLSFTLTGYYWKRNDQSAQAGQPFNGQTAAALFPGAIIASKPWQIAWDYEPRMFARTWGTSLQGKIGTSIGTITTTTSYLDTNNHERVDVDEAFAPACILTFACINYNVRVPEHNFSQEVIFTSNKIGPLKLVAGGNIFIGSGTEPVYVNDLREPLPRAPQLLSPVGPGFQSQILVKTRAYALFAEGDLSLTDKLVLTVGGRLSIEKKTSYGDFICAPAGPSAGDCDTSNLPKLQQPKWTDFTPRVSLKYDIGPRSSVYATFSQGFKGGVIPYNNFTAPPANPEKITAYEIGIKTAGHNFAFNAAAFYYDYKDLQVQITQLAQVILNNAANARIIGIDFDGYYRLSDALRVSGAVSYIPEAKFVDYPNAVAFAPPITAGGLTQYTIDASGDRLFKTPKLTASATLDYVTSINGSDQLSFDLSFYYSSKFFYEPAHQVFTNAYATMGTRLSYKPADSNLKFTLYGKNLTNKAIVNQATPSQASNSVSYAPPREMGVAIEYAF